MYLNYVEQLRVYAKGGWQHPSITQAAASQAHHLKHSPPTLAGVAAAGAAVAAAEKQQAVPKRWRSRRS